MIDVQQLREVFQDKLVKTGNLDDAFIKAVWVAYQQGLADAGSVKITTMEKKDESMHN
jgi:hypothetical protein